MKRIIKRAVSLLIFLPLAVAVVALAEANRQETVVYLDPFAGSAPEGTQITVPLFIVIFVAIMAGVILGSVATYWEQGKYRRASRKGKGEISSLKAEVARLSALRPGEKKPKAS
jgi:uncharacterized integral membrane protein